MIVKETQLVSQVNKDFQGMLEVLKEVFNDKNHNLRKVLMLAFHSIKL